MTSCEVSHSGSVRKFFYGCVTFVTCVTCYKVLIRPGIYFFFDFVASSVNLKFKIGASFTVNKKKTRVPLRGGSLSAT